MEDEIGVYRGSKTIFASSGVKPKFPIVTRLQLHDSAAEGLPPAASFLRFPNMEVLVLAGANVV